MSLLGKIKRELKFHFVHRLAWLKPDDEFTISKGLFRKYLPNAPIIIDCGSHIGTDSIELSKVFPNAQIHSFEAVPAIYQQLKQNVSRYKNINCYQLALADQDGRASMFVSSVGSDGSSSLLKPETHLQDHPNVLFEETINVPTRRLDTWAEENHFQNIDLLWLDMQGFEYQMLIASPKILATVKVIHTEISLKETYEGVINYKQFKQWLEEQGFKMVKEAIPKGTDMGNVLFVRNIF